jgi:hypothetical protein
MDMWRGSPVQVASRLLAVEQFTEPFYRAVAAGAARGGADQRRPGAGELVVCRPATVGGGVCGPGRANPIPASSGQVTRHRLNRSGDRQLNRALHTGVVARLRDDPATRAYAARRRAEGKSSRDIRRCFIG